MKPLEPKTAAENEAAGDIEAGGFVEEIHLAIQRLKDHPGVADGHAVRVKTIENDMETLYAEALAKLFETPKNLEDVTNILKLREIYRHMFHAVQSAEQAADIIGDVIMKFF